MTAGAKSPLVCVVDDDISVRESVEVLIRGEGLVVEMFDAAERFLGQARPEPPACLIVDLSLPGMNGLELQEALVQAGADAPTIFLTGDGDIPTSVQAMKAGALEFLTKPYDADDLVAAVRHAISRRFPAPPAGASLRGGRMVRESEALGRSLQQGDMVAEPAATAPSSGEGRTGREYRPHAVHT